MSAAPETAQDAITEEEISGTAVPSSSHKRDAFAELMMPKAKKITKDSSTPYAQPQKKKTVTFTGRDGLGAYTHDPAAFSASEVIYYNDDFVAVKDLYPKSSLHTLLLPRSPLNRLHPFEAFEDAAFLESVKKEVKVLRTSVANELRRRYGKFSRKDQARERVLNGEEDIPDGEDLPAGRDWEKEVMVGIHAHPSMSHLHVHVLSVDRYSDSMKHRKHYNSFATPFFIDVEDFPLAEDDVRRHPGREGYLDRSLKCWRCGKEFGHAFARLKEHLEGEFEEWKKE